MNQKTAHLTQREKKLRHQKAMRLKKIRRIKRIIKTGSVCLVIVFAVCLFRNITSPEGKNYDQRSEEHTSELQSL